MKAPAFWWRRPGVAALLLSPFAAIYGHFAGRRMRRSGVRPPLPVICVGNFVVGGAGKTPTALALARLAIDMGLKPAFLTRGHGGALKGPVQVDPKLHTAQDVGDEALLLVTLAPVVKALDRAAGLARLTDLGANLCIMDDGFQNPSIAKTLSLVVVDGGVGVGNGLTLPAGPLRAPHSIQMAAADGVLVLGAGPHSARVIAAAARAGKAVLDARTVPCGPRLADDRPLFAFAGIGRPQKFFDQLVADGYRLAGTRAFADHHAFSEADAAEVLEAAAIADAALVTTSKDAARLAGGGGRLAELLATTLVYEVETRFASPTAVRELIAATRDRWLRDTFCRGST